MRKIFIILGLFIYVCSMGQSRTFDNLIVEGEFKTITLSYNFPSTLNLADHLVTDVNQNIWDFSYSSMQLQNGDGKFNFVHSKTDTIFIIDPGQLGFFYDSREKVFDSDVLIDNTFSYVRSEEYNFKNWQAPGKSLWGFDYSTFIFPGDNDTIEVGKMVTTSIQAKHLGTATGDRSAIFDQTILQLYGSYNPGLSVDTVRGVHLWLHDGGIAADSIGTVYGIFNEDDDVRGVDNTYFLYSEYGDNYLNGDLEVTGEIISPYNVKYYGAVGDSVTNDANAFNAAAVAAEAVRGTYRLLLYNLLSRHQKNKI